MSARLGFFLLPLFWSRPERMRLYDAMAVSFSLFTSRVSLFPSSLSRASERGTVLQPSARLFLSLPSYSYSSLPHLVLLLTPHICASLLKINLWGFFCKGGFSGGLNTLIFLRLGCLGSLNYIREGWVSWLVGWLGAGFSCELRLVQQTALRTQAAACSIERAGGVGFGWMAWKAYVGLAGLNVRVFLGCDQLVLLCAGPACA